jgi:acyl-CoA synthetase (NDP forming)
MRTPRRPAPRGIIVAAEPPRPDLARMLRARRVAVIGASERNPFSAPVIRNLDHFGFKGDVLLVNPRGEPVNGRPTLRSPRELDGPIDAAFVCVPSANVIEVVREAAEAGVTGFVIVSSGFAETGPEGVRQQGLLRNIAAERGVTLLGPNALGFLNYVDGVALSVLERENFRGSFGIASVSGSVGGYLAKVAHLQGVGLSHVVLAGNEAGATIADVLDFLVDDPETRSIGVFLEAIYDPERFARAAERALRANKPIVMLKAGASENTARLAAAHTGALVGDDRVFDAAAREMGVCRVDSYEDLIATAVLLEKVGPVARSGVAALTISGGSGEILSDLAGAAGVDFPVFSESIRPAMDAIVSGFGQTHNPLDLTGAALRDIGLWERLLKTIAEDERIGLALCIWDVPIGGEPEWMAETLRSIARGYAAYPAAPPLIATVTEPVSKFGRRALAEAGLPGAIPGLKPAVAALAQHGRWSRRALDPRPVGLFRAERTTTVTERPTGESALLDWLETQSVPVTPRRLAADAAAAVRAAEAIGYPVALKLASPDVAHKSEVGGVRLDLSDADAVRAAFAAIVGGPLGTARIDGVTVSPMRSHAIELIVSVTRDPVWGPMLALGLGGIWVEIFGDSALLPLPVNTAQIVAALRGLKAAPLFDGARGRPVIDLAPVAHAIASFAQAALALGPELAALEINPLAVSPDRAEAMDALALWA